MLLASCRFPVDYIQLGNGYVIDQENKYHLSLLKSVYKNHSYQTIIPGALIDYNFDDNHIVLLRLVVGREGLDSDILPDTPKPYQLWINDKNSHKVYGPFNLNDYFKTRHVLNISDKIKVSI